MNQSYFDEYFLTDYTDDVVSAKFLPLNSFFKFIFTLFNFFIFCYIRNERK